MTKEHSCTSMRTYNSPTGRTVHKCLLHEFIVGHDGVLSCDACGGGKNLRFPTFRGDAGESLGGRLKPPRPTLRKLPKRF